MSTVQDWLTLHMTPKLGAVGCKKLIEAFGSPKEVLLARQNDLIAVGGVQKTACACLANHPPIEQAELELERAQKLGIEIISIEDTTYPELLRSIYAPPIILYLRGRLETLLKPSLAIVGSRAATSYGLKIAQQMAQELGRRGVGIVSGMALGIDTAAHIGCLKAPRETIGVLGCGVDVVYPRQNYSLYKRIQTEGAILSEYPLGTKPEAFRFPARNRIISGLASGVLVVEAAKKSGSLITARMALEEGRDVFAIPGRVDSFKSAGTHKLLQEGAKLVHTVDDILEELYFSHQEKKEQTSVGMPPSVDSETDDEKTLLAILDAYPQDVDTIIQRSRLSAAKVNEILLLLEMQEKVERQPDGSYGRLIK